MNQQLNPMWANSPTLLIITIKINRFQSETVLEAEMSETGDSKPEPIKPELTWWLNNETFVIRLVPVDRR